MKQAVKISFRLFSTIVLCVIVLPLLVSLLLRNPAVQQRLIRFVTERIHDRTGISVSLSGVGFDGFYRVHAYGFCVLDLDAPDTLLYVPDVSASLASYGIWGSRPEFRNVQVKGGEMNLRSYADSTSNIKRIVLKMRGDREKKGNTEIFFGKIDVEDFTFRFQKENFQTVEYGINYQDMELQRITGRVEELHILGDSVSMAIPRIALRERSGVTVPRFQLERLTVTPRQLTFTNGSAALDSSYFDFSTVDLRFREWKLYDFVNRIPLRIDITRSHIDFRTVAKFTKKPRAWKSVIDFSGTYNGRVCDAHGVVRHASFGSTELSDCTYSIRGIPDIANTVFNIRVNRMLSSVADIHGVAADFSNKPFASLPDYILKDEKLELAGNFAGKLDDFIAACTVKQPESGGGAALNLNLRNGKRRITLGGGVKMRNFDLSKLLPVERLSTIDCDLGVDGHVSRKSMDLQLRGRIDTLRFNDYPYRNIELDGEVKNGAYRGLITSRDPNLDFGFNGMFELVEGVPYYNCTLQVNRADLHALHFNRRDSVSVLRGEVTANIFGGRIDDLNGVVTVDHLTYINHIDTTRADSPITVMAENNPQSKRLLLKSDFVDFDLKGGQSYKKLFRYFENTIREYLPALQTAESRDLKEQMLTDVPDDRPSGDMANFYAMTLNVKEANNIANIFVPGLSLAKGTRLTFLLNPLANVFSLNLASDHIAYKENLISNLNVDSRNIGDSVSFYLRADEMFVSNIYAPNLSLVGGIRQDNIQLSARFNNEYDHTGAFFRTNSYVTAENGMPTLHVGIEPSYISLGNMTWNIPRGAVVIDSSRIVVDRFRIDAPRRIEGRDTIAAQSLGLDGVISGRPTDTLSLYVKDFSLRPLQFLLKRFGFRIEGRVNGRVDNVALRSRSQRRFLGDLRFSDLEVDGHKAEELRFVSRWNEPDREMRFNMAGKRKYIDGYYRSESSAFRADVDIDSFNLALIHPFLAGVSTRTGGTADVKVSFANPEGRFAARGEVKVSDFALTVGYTNVTYRTSGVVKALGDRFVLEPTTVYDPDGDSGTLQAEIATKGFRDIGFSVRVQPKEMLCFNTDIEQNKIFYGKVYASGDVTVQGNRSDVTLDIDAVTAKKSEFFLPLNTKSTITEADFITFVKKGGEEKPQRQLIIRRRLDRARTKNLAVNVNVRVLENTETEIVIDPMTGSSIKVAGTGDFRIHVRPAESVFTIQGEYVVDRGTYRFILPNFNVVDKYFTINRGGWIRWNGDPLGAVLDMQAVYKLKAPLSPLLGDADIYRRRVNVECVLSIRDQLLEPDISLGIEVPDADTETQSLVRSVLNTQEAISTQLFFLLFSNSFYSTGTNAGGNTNIGVTSSVVTGIEFLTNQIKNIVSNDKFDFGIHYRPKGDITSDEVGVDFSTPLLENRLYLDLNGTYNFQNNKAEQASMTTNQISGDIYLTWILDRDGNLQLKGFSKTIDTFDENQGLQESGVGVYYQDEFNKFSELVQRYKTFFRTRKERKQQKKAERAEKRAQKSSE